ncbi:MAG: hypothetical protein BGO67_02155 [Alphaproteobacteria bacterium 41-28]|nr:MAG: hypothetical protein BGO67_02155 [Alphaproteobacteria bacterium 41-28]
MFNIIEPKDHHLFKTIVDFFSRFIIERDMLYYSFQDHKRATFIAIKNQSDSVLGGAILLKQRIGILHQRVGQHLSTLAPNNGEVWTCSLFLQGENHSLSQGESFCKLFYQQLVAFGMKEKIEFLCMILEQGEYFFTEIIGSWPYVFEVQPHESRDGLFHGILSLTINSSTLHKKKEESIFYKEIKLAA